MKESILNQCIEVSPDDLDKEESTSKTLAIEANSVTQREDKTHFPPSQEVGREEPLQKLEKRTSFKDIKAPKDKIIDMVQLANAENPSEKKDFTHVEQSHKEDAGEESEHIQKDNSSFFFTFKKQ